MPNIKEFLLERKVASAMAAGMLVTGVGLGYYGKELSHSENDKLPVTRTFDIRSFPLHDQADRKWRLTPEWGEGRATCGPTTISMALSLFGDTISPLDLDKEWQKLGLRNGPFGGTMLRTGSDIDDNDVLGWLERRGYEWTQVADYYFAGQPSRKLFDFSMAKSVIAEGYVIVASGKVRWVDLAPKDLRTGLYAGTDHIFLVIDVDEKTGILTIADPWGGAIRKKAITEINFEGGYLSYAYGIRPTQQLQNRLASVNSSK